MIRIHADFAIRKSHLYNSWKSTRLAKSVKLQIDGTVFLIVIYVVVLAMNNIITIII
jgi:hypothetical protein